MREGGRFIVAVVRAVAAGVTARWRIGGVAVRLFFHRNDYAYCIGFAYQHFLGRPPDPEGLKHFSAALGNGMSIPRFLRHIDSTEEAESYRLQRALNVYGLPHGYRIMGTNRHLTPVIWRERAVKVKRTRQRANFLRHRHRGRNFIHSGNYVVSAIASLYKGRRYLDAFLDNIASQTIFDRSELIIIDANSPEREHDLIARYQSIYSNIVYWRLGSRIGIYEAWNRAIGMARGRYITNTNLDDLRRQDSFELQAAVLDQNSAVDVVYQDFFYSLDSSLTFDEVAQCGFRSELPPAITAQNLLLFNSPHNAPMWRKALHDELGLFDESFKSAGDYEFWLRCLSKGRIFRKIATPHVVYYLNPEGISTRPNTLGIEEGERLIRHYRSVLTSE